MAAKPAINRNRIEGPDGEAYDFFIWFKIGLKSFLKQNKTKWRESKPGADEVKTKYFELKEQYGDDFTKMTMIYGPGINHSQKSLLRGN